MSLKTSSKGGDFAPAPEGTHVAICVRVIDLGTQPGNPKFGNVPRPKVQITWELTEELIETRDGLMPQLVTQRYTRSTHPKSQLRQVLEGWRGRAFTQEEEDLFDIGTILGVPCMLSVVHSPDGKYANVRSVSKLPKGMPAPTRVHPRILYEIEEGESEGFERFSENLKATIRESEEFKKAKISAGASEATPPQGADDSDIPF